MNLRGERTRLHIKRINHLIDTRLKFVVSLKYHRVDDRKDLRPVPDLLEGSREGQVL